MSCEHHRADFEGPFFSTLLSAVGVRHPQPKSITDKRFALMCRLSELLQMRSGHIVVLLCDEAQSIANPISRHEPNSVLRYCVRCTGGRGSMPWNLTNLQRRARSGIL